jgi:hypothetical protein
MSEIGNGEKAAYEPIIMAQSMKGSTHFETDCGKRTPVSMGDMYHIL